MASNTESPETGNKGPEMMAVMWSMTMLATMLVVARICVRKRILRSLGVDDWLIGASMIFGLIFVAAATISVSYGYGQHTKDLDIEDAETALLWNMISFIFGIVSFALPKLAVAALLHRILNPSTIQRIIIWGLVSLVAAIAVVNIIIYLTMCNPLQALWKTSMVVRGEATCRDIWILIDYATFNGAFSAFVDLSLAVFPGIILFQLQMSLRKKIALSAALGLGSIAAATAMVKCAQIKGLADQTDPTFSTVPLVVWTNVEANVVVIAACIPTLQPMLDLILRKFNLASTGKTRSKQSVYPQHKIYDNRYTSQAVVSRKEKPTTLTRKESQENILNYSHQHQIRRTDEVHVEYEMHPPKPSLAN